MKIKVKSVESTIRMDLVLGLVTLFTGNEKRLDILMMSEQATAIIQVQKEKKPTLPPLAYLLITKILNKFNRVVGKVEISEFKNGMYFCSLFIKDEKEKEIVFECGVSEAVALAIEWKVPIYVEEKLFDQSPITKEELEKMGISECGLLN